MRQDDMELQEKYLDWYFLNKFNKPVGYWRKLTDEDIETLMTFQEEEDKKYWETWVKILNKLLGGK
jgi:hypothetical protein